MRRRIKPIFILAFFALFIFFILITKAMADQERAKAEQAKTSISSSSISPSSSSTAASSMVIDEATLNKPIIDLSGWQLPSKIDYDSLAKYVSGAIIRIQSGSHTTKENNATDANGVDKAYKTHIEELQKRGVPVAVYAYVTGSSEKVMRQEARSFYKLASPYKPTFYWLDVEEKTMEDMDAGVEAFRQELEKAGVENIGIYIGTYFMDDHSISVDKFDAVWIPTYGSDSGYFETLPVTDIDYDLHQYTSKGWASGISEVVDLNQLSPLKDRAAIYRELFTIQE